MGRIARVAQNIWQLMSGSARLFLALALLFGLTGLWYVVLSLEARSWPQTDGLIVDAQIEPLHGGERDFYSLSVRYAYEVGGQRFESNTIYPGGFYPDTPQKPARPAGALQFFWGWLKGQLGFDRPIHTAEHVNDLADVASEYTAGSSVAVYYDPSSPAKAVLKPQLMPHHFQFLLIAALFSVAALFSILWSLIRRGMRLSGDSLRFGCFTTVPLILGLFLTPLSLYRWVRFHEPQVRELSAQEACRRGAEQSGREYEYVSVSPTIGNWPRLHPTGLKRPAYAACETAELFEFAQATQQGEKLRGCTVRMHPESLGEMHWIQVTDRFGKLLLRATQSDSQVWVLSQPFTSEQRAREHVSRQRFFQGKYINLSDVPENRWKIDQFLHPEWSQTLRKLGIEGALDDQPLLLADQAFVTQLLSKPQLMAIENCLMLELPAGIQSFTDEPLSGQLYSVSAYHRRMYGESGISLSDRSARLRVVSVAELREEHREFWLVWLSLGSLFLMIGAAPYLSKLLPR